jgi:hypothetical protein
MSDGLRKHVKLARDLGKVDSEGEFTLNLTAARLKLSQFNLADSHQFILRAAQAAHVGAKTLLVRLSRTPSLRLENLRQRFTLEEIITRLSRGETVGRDTLDHLCAAVATLVSQVPEGVTLRLKQNGKRKIEVLQFGSENKLSVEQDTKTEGSWFQLSWPSRSGLKKSALRELVLSQCAFGVAEVQLNGRIVAPSLPPPKKGATVQGFKKSDILVCHRYGAGSRAWKAEGKILEETCFSESERVATLCSTAGLSADAQVSLVIDGVRTEPQSLPLDMKGVFIVVDGSDLETDLSGLSLRSKSVGQVRSWLEEKVQSLYSATLSTIDSQPRKTADTRESFWVHKGTNQLDVWVGMGLLFAPIWAVMNLEIAWDPPEYISYLIPLWVCSPLIWVLFMKAWRRRRKKRKSLRTCRWDELRTALSS